MEKLLEIVKQIDNPYVLGVVVILTYFFYLTKDSWSTVISKLRLTKNKYDIIDLKNHDLFTEMLSYKGFKTEFYTHGSLDTTKNKIFNDFLELKIDSTIENMISICEESTEDLSKAELKHLVNSCFNKCNLTLADRLKQRFLDNGLNKSDADIIIDKFYDLRTEAMSRYNKRIESIFACDFYQSNFHLILALYEIIAFEIEDVVKDGVKCFEEINGTFLDLDYGK